MYLNIHAHTRERERGERARARARARARERERDVYTVHIHIYTCELYSDRQIFYETWTFYLSKFAVRIRVNGQSICSSCKTNYCYIRDI